MFAIGEITVADNDFAESHLQVYPMVVDVTPYNIAKRFCNVSAECAYEAMMGDLTAFWWSVKFLQMCVYLNVR